MTGAGRARPIVLVHGAWHGSWGWSARDAAARGGRPRSAARRHGGPRARARPCPRARSPGRSTPRRSRASARRTRTSRSRARPRRLVAQIEAVGRPVVLVGAQHGRARRQRRGPARARSWSSGSSTCARSWPASGADAGAYVQSTENEGELVGPLVVADPGVVGAIRLDVRSPDPALPRRTARGALRRRARGARRRRHPPALERSARSGSRAARRS